MAREDTGFTPDVSQMILARASGHCEILIDGVCVQTAATIHHRRPRGMGGTRRDTTNFASNGLLACVSCHEFVEHERLWAKDHGFLVRQGADPSAQPVWWRCAMVRENGKWVKAWRLLDHLGGMKVIQPQQNTEKATQ